MPSVLPTHAVEKSTYVVTVTFTDENGAACDPVSMTWTLTDSAGTVVNSREDVVVAAPASVVKVVLSGNDLDPTSDAMRYLTVEGTYNSDLGSGLPFKDQAQFVIDNLLAV